MNALAVTFIAFGVVLLAYALFGLIVPRLPGVRTRPRAAGMVLVAIAVLGFGPYLSPKPRDEIAANRARRERQRAATETVTPALAPGTGRSAPLPEPSAYVLNRMVTAAACELCHRQALSERPGAGSPIGHPYVKRISGGNFELTHAVLVPNTIRPQLNDTHPYVCEIVVKDTTASHLEVTVSHIRWGDVIKR